jgi:hypothetical protein
MPYAPAVLPPVSITSEFGFMPYALAVLPPVSGASEYGFCCMVREHPASYD